MTAQAAAPKRTEAEVDETLQRIQRHQRSARFSEADRLIEDLMSELGKIPRLLHLKGLNEAMSGNIQVGEALLREGLEAAPEDPIQNVDLGVLLAQIGRLDEAITHFRTAVEAAPNFEMAHTNLGSALFVKKEYREAIAHLERAIALDGRLLDAHTNLGRAYLQQGQVGKAIEVLYKALAIDPLSVRAHVQLASALFRHERHDAAEHHARRAIELDPNASEAYLYLGNALAAAGKMDEAAEALLKIAGTPPAGLAALSRLVHMRKTTEESPEFAMLNRYLDNQDQLGEEARVSVHFAMGKALDDLGRYEEAFGHYKEANMLNNTLHPFEAEAFVARANALRDLFSPAFLKRCGDGGITDIAPVFITGMPRSGTTLMDQMFSGHPLVTAGGELRAVLEALHQSPRIRQALQRDIGSDELTSDDFSKLGETYADIVRAEGIKTEFLSDKMPSNHLYSGAIALALPRAKILFMRRHPLDCLLSNYFQHFSQNQPASSDFSNLATTYKEFDRMVQHWSKVIPDRVRVVNYEDVVADTKGQMRSVLDFVGLDWDDGVLDYRKSSRQVITASIAQVREPIYTRAVARWEKYAPHLAPLARELRDYLSAEDLSRCGVE
ncbi:sulfotransferase [Primorskyibacter aestuariivivens]|uniref:tetratricopeptide repeat-containing sulfotransferase family protein n=1 Tax=Primorskyibacter aestuariivivens TaxID=1888912 RepID=UPI0023011C61|nr:tetratricopeptide repeat-containing sulfotransferase family protein [Primorskyibacter aestuariivivens]MDA7429592.1 sulfotransferase [Primorskyibacter aestuariivivens]